MWLFLFTELLLFGGLFILYAVYFSRYAAGFAAGARQLSLVFGTVNTVILLTSSMLVAMAVTAVQKDQRRLAQWLLVGTMLCALVFLADKYLEWSAKIGHGIYPGSPKLAVATPGESVFFSLYYLTTGLHGLHVTVGGLLLGWVTVKLRQGAIGSTNYVWLENGALYWHLVDLIWIFIFPLYYLVL
jgi:cytochrome c oxidase subunit 3